jgi:hypothetical protein
MCSNQEGLADPSPCSPVLALRGCIKKRQKWSLRKTKILRIAALLRFVKDRRNEMLIRTALFILSVLAIALFGALTPAHAQQNCTSTVIGNQVFTNCTGGYENNAFQNGYNAATSGMAIGAQRRNTEAIINEMRAQRGQPPCSMTPLGTVFTGRSMC